MTIYFRAYVKGETEREVAVPFTYPGGEHHLKELLDNRDPSTVWIADVRGAQADDLVHAALLADVAHQRLAPFVLMLPYLPAARSDRGEPTGAQVYADLVNAMNAQQVIGIDPHSSVITSFLHKLTVLDPFLLLGRALREAGHWSDHDTIYDAVISPDKGAMRRATRTAEMLNTDCYQAEKHRDFDTGRITSITMEKLPASGRYLVVDDICDGGATFNRLAEVAELPRERLGLWVTHGIFSGKATELRQHYEHIYTTDSHPGHKRVGVATVIVPTETYMFHNLKGGRGHGKDVGERAEWPSGATLSKSPASPPSTGRLSAGGHYYRYHNLEFE